MTLNLSKEDWALADDYALTFSTSSGRTVLRDLEQTSGMFDDFLPPGPIDTHRMTAGLGARKLYLHIRTKLVEAAETDRKVAVVIGAQDAWGDPKEKKES